MKKWLSLVAFMLPVALVFSLGVTGGHIGFDDRGYTSGCPFVRDGFTWQNVRRAFCDFGYGAIWMPVTFMSYMADVSLFGDNWHVYHAVNVAFHLCNFILVAFFFAGIMRRLSYGSDMAIWIAALSAALLWAVHPMRADAVSYVASRKEELWTLFSLAGLMAYMRFLDCGGACGYIASFAMFIMACMSKPTAIAFPFLAAALHMLPGVRGRWRRLAWLLPMLLVSAATGLVAMYSQSHPTDAEQVGLFDAALSWRVLNAVVSLGLYLYYTAIPAGIHVDYLAVFNGWPNDGWLGIGVFSLAVTLAVLGFARAGGRTRIVLCFSAMVFLSSIGPTLGIFGYVNGDQAMADRYTYFPHIAIFLLLACLLARFAATGKSPRLLAFAVGAAVALECAFAVPVVRSYENGFTAFSRALAKDPGNWRALRVVGNEYCARMNRCREGIAMLRKSLAIRNSKATADSLAYVLALKGAPGDFAEVKRLGAESVRNPETDKGGMMLDALGIVDMREGNFRSAVRMFSAALRAKARNHSSDYTLLWLGLSLANAGSEREALYVLSRAGKSRVLHVRRRSGEAIALLKEGRKTAFGWEWANDQSLETRNPVP